MHSVRTGSFSRHDALAVLAAVAIHLVVSAIYLPVVWELVRTGAVNAGIALIWLLGLVLLNAVAVRSYFGRRPGFLLLPLAAGAFAYAAYAFRWLNALSTVSAMGAFLAVLILVLARPWSAGQGVNPVLGRIRKAWAILLVYCVLSYAVSFYASFIVGSLTQPYLLLMFVVDAVIIYGLYGYVFRKPIRHIVLRFLYLALAVMVIIRLCVAAYVLAPNLGRLQLDQFASLLLLSAVPLGLLTAVALWRYATTTQVAHAVVPVSEGN